MYSYTFFIFLLVSINPLTLAHEDNSLTEDNDTSVTTTEVTFEPVTTTCTTTSTTIPTTTLSTTTTTEPTIIGCTCGIFLSGQFKKGSSEPPKGNPALLFEKTENFPCTNFGKNQCSYKCVEGVSKKKNFFLLN